MFRGCDFCPPPFICSLFKLPLCSQMLLPSSVSTFRALISRAISLRPFCEASSWFFPWDVSSGFFLHFESVLAFLALGGTAASPSGGSEPRPSPLPQLLAVSHSQVLVRAPCFIPSESRSRRLRPPGQCRRGEGLSERPAAGAPPWCGSATVCRHGPGGTWQWPFLSVSCIS